MDADLMLELLVLPVALVGAVALGRSLDGRDDGETIPTSRIWKTARLAVLVDAGLIALLGIELGIWWQRPSVVLFFVVQLFEVVALGAVALRRSGHKLPTTTALLGGVWLLAAVPIAVLDDLAELEGPSQPEILGLAAGLVLGIALLAGPIAMGVAALVDVGHRRGVMTSRVAALGALAACVGLVWPLTTASATLAFGSCAPGWLVGSDPVLCVRYSEDADSIVVSGETDLPDGTVLLLERGDLDLTEKADATKIVVKDGQIAGRTPRSGPSTLRVVFRVAPWHNADGEDLVLAASDQPQAVIDRFGRDGAGIRGPYAGWYGGCGFLRCADQLQAVAIEFSI